MSQESSNQDMATPPVLALLPNHKPPRPALPRPLNITAYTKPDLYPPYIKSVLTPATTSVARSSLTNIVDTKALAHLRKENRAQFDNLIAHEIKQGMQNAPSTWIRDVLLPKGALPTNFNERFRNSKMWDATSESWTALPSENFTEESLELWLNWVAPELAILFQLYTPEGVAKYPARDRSWDRRSATTLPDGGTISRKPDLSLISRDNRMLRSPTTRTAWPVIQAFAEVTPKTKTFTYVVRNIVEKAYLMFESQPFRRYVIALGFFGPPDEPKWALVLVDRSGVISSSRFSFSGSGGITLAQVLYILSHGEPTHIGIDETMTIDPVTGTVTHITVEGQSPTLPIVSHTFEVVRLLHAATVRISGRATRVWLVRESGQYYILKDSWPLQSRPFSEIDHLLKINKTILADTKENQALLEHTYPILIVGQDFGDYTSEHRIELTGKPPSRTHRRIVTEPIGDPLTSFRNKFELCSVLCDVVTFLQYTTVKCRVCHGDISLHNVVINRVWDDDVANDDDSDVDDTICMIESSDSSAGSSNNVNSELTTLSDSSVNANTSRPSEIKAYGLVIDNDNSFDLDDAAKLGYRIKSGTLPFMALDSLKRQNSSDFMHEPKHDLESLFYVLLTVCTYTAGPGRLRSHIPEAQELSICFNEWWDNFDHHQLARCKAAQLDSFKDYVLDRLPSYWTDFHPVLEGLHAALWEKECSVLKQENLATHDAFLKVLREARERYRDANEDARPYASLNEFNSEKSTHLRETAGKDVNKEAVTEFSSQKRSFKDSSEDVDEGTQRGKKAARADNNNHVGISWTEPVPHNIRAHRFSSYVDSGEVVFL